MFIHVFSSPVGPLLGGSSALPELGGNFSSLQAFQVKPMDRLWNLEYSLRGAYPSGSAMAHKSWRSASRSGDPHTTNLTCLLPRKKKDMAAEPSMPSQCFCPILPGNCWLQHLQPFAGLISTPGEVVKWSPPQWPKTSGHHALWSWGRTCAGSLVGTWTAKPHQFGCTTTQLQGSSMPTTLGILRVWCSRAANGPWKHEALQSLEFDSQFIAI